MTSVPENSVAVAATSSSQGTTLPNAQVYAEYFLTEGLEGVKHKKYRGPRSFTNTIDQQISEGLSNNTSKYVVFRSITQKQLEKINRIRNTRYKGLRFTYLNRKQALIVKIMIGATHEAANRKFASMVAVKASRMGVEDEFGDMGSTAIKAPGSRGEVKLVVLIFVSESDKHVHIEKWELVTGKNKRITRANPHSFRDIPTQTHELDIVGDVVTGAPLRLEFEKIMLRQPSSEEGDIIFGTQDLKRLASFVWRSTQ